MWSKVFWCIEVQFDTSFSIILHNFPLFLILKIGMPLCWHSAKKGFQNNRGTVLWRVLGKQKELWRNQRSFTKIKILCQWGISNLYGWRFSLLWNWQNYNTLQSWYEYFFSIQIFVLTIFRKLIPKGLISIFTIFCELAVVY